MSRARRYVPGDVPTRCDLPFWPKGIADDDPIYCGYCGSWMDDYDDPGLWDVAFERFAAAHEEGIRHPYFGGPDVGHPHVVLRGNVVDRKVCLHICRKCGWWLAEDRAVLPAVQWQYWAVTLTSAPVLEELALEDVHLPLEEVRRYLARKFEARASMHPRLFELTVASVFRDLGYRTSATAYSRDGGVDVVLHGSTGKRIGVQVKRHKNTVEVEQIRAFVGALMLGGYAGGVYVSASRFSRGAKEAACLSTQAILPIQLVDAERFFDMLGYAQLSRTPRPRDCGISKSRPLQFRAYSHCNLNSL